MSCTFRVKEECILLKEYVKSEIPYSTICRNENGSYAGDSCAFMNLDGLTITSALSEYMSGSHFKETRKNGLAKV